MFLEMMKMREEYRFVRTPYPKSSIPPRPEIIKEFLRTGWVFQEKINGRRIQIHIPHRKDKPLQFYTRQGSRHTSEIPESLQEMLRAYYAPRTGWNVLEGEFVPELSKIFLFDIIIENSTILSHLNFVERHSLLKRDFIHPQLSVLRVYKTLKDALKILIGKEIWIEGLIFKSLSAGLEDRTVVRCRKTA